MGNFLWHRLAFAFQLASCKKNLFARLATIRQYFSCNLVSALLPVNIMLVFYLAVHGLYRLHRHLFNSCHGIDIRLFNFAALLDSLHFSHLTSSGLHIEHGVSWNPQNAHSYSLMPTNLKAFSVPHSGHHSLIFLVVFTIFLISLKNRF